MIPVFGTASAVVQALTDAVSSAAADCQSAISSVLPVALPVMGAIVVVSVGIRVFKKAVR